MLSVWPRSFGSAEYKGASIEAQVSGQARWRHLRVKRVESRYVYGEPANTELAGRIASVRRVSREDSTLARVRSHQCTARPDHGRFARRCPSREPEPAYSTTAGACHSEILRDALCVARVHPAPRGKDAGTTGLDKSEHQARQRHAEPSRSSPRDNSRLINL